MPLIGLGGLFRILGSFGTFVLTPTIGPRGALTLAFGASTGPNAPRPRGLNGCVCFGSLMIDRGMFSFPPVYKYDLGFFGIFPPLRRAVSNAAATA